MARVLSWKCDLNGRAVSTAHKQPVIDTCIYEVHFQDGRTKELAANTIAEVLYAQCDPDKNQYVMLDAIVVYRKNPDVAISWNNQVKIINSKKVVSFSTRGWELCCEWKDAVLLGRNCQTSRSLTHSRLLSLHLPWAWPMNQPSTGG